MDARYAAIRTMAYVAGLASVCTGAAFFLIREKPVFAWLAPFAVGSALVLYGFGGIRKSLAARHWQVARGTVISSELREIFVPGKTGGYVEYVPEIRTQYTSSAGTFTTDRYSLVAGDFQGDRVTIQKILEAYPVGALVDVYVDPAFVDSGCLRPVPSPRRQSQHLAAIIGGLLVLGVALWAYAQT